MTSFIEWHAFAEDELNGRLESEARKLECRVGVGQEWLKGHGTTELVPVVHRNCSASACAHWRWLHRGGTRCEKRTFESEFPMPTNVRDAPADVAEGWTFMEWDYNVTAAKNGARPRYWASRPIEIILPRGLCGLAGEI